MDDLMVFFYGECNHLSFLESSVPRTLTNSISHTIQFRQDFTELHLTHKFFRYKYKIAQNLFQLTAQIRFKFVDILSTSAYENCSLLNGE